MQSKALVLLVLFLFTTHSYAFFASSKSSFELKFLAGAKALYGSNASEDETSIVDRNHAIYAADVVIGLRWKLFLVGYGMEYALWRQLDKPADVGNSNTQGTAITHSFVGGVHLIGNLGLLAKYYISSEFELDQADSSGNTVIYTEPGGLSFQLLWRWSKRTYVGLEYSQISYEAVDVSGTETQLGEASQLNNSAIGLTYGFTF